MRRARARVALRRRRPHRRRRLRRARYRRCCAASSAPARSVPGRSRRRACASANVRACFFPPNPASLATRFSSQAVTSSASDVIPASFHKMRTLFTPRPGREAHRAASPVPPRALFRAPGSSGRCDLDHLLRDRFPDAGHLRQLTAGRNRRDRLGKAAQRVCERAIGARFERIVPSELEQIGHLFEGGGNGGVIHDLPRVSHASGSVSPPRPPFSGGFAKFRENATRRREGHEGVRPA